MALVPTNSNVRWGPHALDIYDIFRHPTRDAGGNPMLIYKHTGGGAKDDFYNQSGTIAFIMFSYLLDSARDVHFDCMSIETPEYRLATRGRSVQFPECTFEAQAAICGIKARAADFGQNSAKMCAMGESFGGWVFLMSQIFQPYVPQLGQKVAAWNALLPRQGFYITQPVDSSLKGLINLDGVVDWRKLATPRGIKFTNGVWSGTTITSTGSFTNYRDDTQDRDLLVVTAPSNIAGTYQITGKTNDTLTMAVSKTVTGVAGYVPTDQLELNIAFNLYGGPTTLSSASAASWDALPRSMIEQASPMWYAQNDRASYLCPVYNQYSVTNATGHTPYGSSWTSTYGGTPNVHDPAQGYDLHAALRAIGKSSEYSNVLRTAWTTSDSIRLYNWLCQRLLDV